MRKGTLGGAVRKDTKYEIGEFWTSKQRQSHTIHYTISYRAAFKPELPQYFISRYLHKKKQTILDPFGGRGTTAIQANLDGHYAIHNDINPLSLFLAESRQVIPSYDKMESLLQKMDLDHLVGEEENDSDLLHFYHKNTLNQIKNLKKIYKLEKSPEMKYIMLTALSRLHGHSKGFFSVYTFPQISISPSAQKKNNEKRNQTPDFRPLKERILKKMRTDLVDPLPPFYHEFSKKNVYSLQPSTNMQTIPSESVDLIVTSPPFLDKVDYITDNWLKAWFLDVDLDALRGVSILHSPSQWKEFITSTLKECQRVLKKKSLLVMEVGDVLFKGMIINLDDLVLHAAVQSGLSWEKTVINSQKFTKLSNCWNVSNNEKGTNSNRCVVLSK
jgi:DNA modification methylase